MGNSPGNKPDFFQRREFTFNLPGDIYVRYKCFRDADEFKRAVLADMPERIEIGPVYTATPDKNKVLKKDVFKPVERELIFDLDMNDYDDIRTCCSGASVCKKCALFFVVLTLARCSTPALTENGNTKQNTPLLLLQVLDFH